MKVELQPWSTPNFVIAVTPPQSRQDGFLPDSVPKFLLHDLTPETLSAQCDAFRAEVFRKAGKTDPANSTHPPGDLMLDTEAVEAIALLRRLRYSPTEVKAVMEYIEKEHG